MLTVNVLPFAPPVRLGYRLASRDAGGVTLSDKKRDRAIAAAADVFLRYGYARTTMGDIAQAAGMSRPALYLIFPGKEHAFEAGTMFLARSRLDEIRVSIQNYPGLKAKLARACTMLLVSVFDLQQSAPDSRDMDDLSFPVVRAIYALFEAFFASVIAEERPVSALPPEQTARLLLYGCRGLRDIADSSEHYAALIEANVALICAALDLA